MPVSKRRTTTGHTGLDMAIQITSMSATLSQLIPIPALSIATSTVLAIIDVVAEVKTNKTECARLAWRASQMLLQLARQMEGKWATAPPALSNNIREFEQTLTVIHEFMSTASDASWLKRLVGKSTIEDNMRDMNVRLDSAAQSFQIASLIEIHHTLGGLDPSRLLAKPASECLPMPVPEPAVSASLIIAREKGVEVSPLLDGAPDTNPFSPVDGEVNDFMRGIEGSKDEHGFSIYHQAEVRIGRTHRRGVGWFSETADAQVDGHRVTVKRYGASTQDKHRWVHDVKLLRQLFHANIPQLVGYSDGQTAVPFVLLSNGPTKDVGLYAQNLLKNESLAKCAISFLDIYRDILSASTHVQQQLSITDEALQDFVEGATYTVDDNKVLMGLAPPKDGWHTFRSYNLCESLVDRALKYLKNRDEMEQSSTAGSLARTANVERTRQLMALLEALLPSRTDAPQLSPDLEDLLDDGDPELADLRRLALASGRHEHSWCERCPTGAAALGDYGVLANDGKSFDSFQVLGNIFEDGSNHALERVKEVDGEVVRFDNGRPDREQARPYLLPDELEGWPIALMPQGKATVFTRRQVYLTCSSEAWRYFLKHTPSLAQRHGIAAHSLLLITRTQSVNDFQVTDWSAPLLPCPGVPNAIAHHHSAHVSHFGARDTYEFRSPSDTSILTPNIVYLFTSGKQDIVPYLTDDPMGRPRPQPTRSTNWCFSCSSGWPVHYVNYIQLDAEDCP